MIKLNRENFEEIKSFLEEKARFYNARHFIEKDPISIPHRFKDKEDIEIAGFLTSVISWGNRTSIINSSNKILAAMGDRPAEFIYRFREKQLKKFRGLGHRTFQEADLSFFLWRLHHLYVHEKGLEGLFSESLNKHNGNMAEALSEVKTHFFSAPHLPRTEKHLPNPKKGSAAKRINMYLRWMARPSDGGVDFGIWKKISTRDLILPLDVHTGNVSRKLGILKRKQNDWQAAAEVTDFLKKMNPEDPVWFDYALFGLGVFEKF